MEQYQGYVDSEYLRLAAERFMQLKRRSYEAMHIQTGDHVLDVGCGPATDTLTMATLVGNAGQVVGIDSDPEMITAAEQRTMQAGLSNCVTHKLGDVTMLPFADEEFQACRSERLFQHLNDPVRALSEMARVTSPGGWVVSLDTDWASISLDAEYVETERRLARVLAEHIFNNGYAPRQLYRLYKQQGFHNISVDIIPNMITNYPLARTLALMDRAEELAVNTQQVTKEELNLWHESLRRAHEAGTFFGSVNTILIAGQK